MRIPRALGIEIVTLVFVPVLCMGAIFLLDAEDLWSLEVWEWFPGNVAFLLAPKGLWWAIWRVFPSRAARLGGMLAADTLGLALTLPALIQPGEAGWLWYWLYVVPAMVTGAVLALAAERAARARDRRPDRRSWTTIIGCLLMFTALLSLPVSQRQWRRVSFPIDLKPGIATSPSFETPGRTTYRVELVS